MGRPKFRVNLVDYIEFPGLVGILVFQALVYGGSAGLNSVCGLFKDFSQPAQLLG
jgi:hypothetical protein